jgi:predicted NBD/HSP70 family sugar kinase
VAGLNRDIPRRDIALGVQLGGPVDSRRGIVLFFRKHVPYLGDALPDFRWDRFPLAGKLQQATGYATVVENDANAFAERERWLGVGKLARRFVVVLIREGIGGSVVSKGEIFSGPVEIGQFINSIGGLRPSDTGQMGTIEAKAGMAAIIEEITDKTHRDVRDINEAAALAADPATSAEALEVFTSAGVAIACTIGYLINFAWPSHAVLYAPPVMLGAGQPAASAFLEEAEKFNNFVAFEPHKDCEFIARPLHLLDGAQGAAMLALSRCHQIRPLPPSSVQPAPLGRRP